MKLISTLTLLLLVLTIYDTKSQKQKRNTLENDIQKAIISLEEAENAEVVTRQKQWKVCKIREHVDCLFSFKKLRHLKLG